MKYLLYLLIIIILFGLNVGLAFVFQLKFLVPTLLLILIITFAVDRESRDFFFVAVAAGLFLDFYSRSTVGSFSLTFLLCAYILNLAVNAVAVLEISWKLLLVIAPLTAGIMYVLVWGYSLLMLKTHLSDLTFAFRVSDLIKEAIFSALLVLPLYVALDFLRGRIERLLSKQAVIK